MSMGWPKSAWSKYSPAPPAARPRANAATAMFLARSTESLFSHNSGQQIPSQTQAMAASTFTASTLRVTPALRIAEASSW